MSLYVPVFIIVRETRRKKTFFKMILNSFIIVCLYNMSFQNSGIIYTYIENSIIIVTNNYNLLFQLLTIRYRENILHYITLYWRYNLSIKNLLLLLSLATAIFSVLQQLWNFLKPPCKLGVFLTLSLSTHREDN